MDSLSSGFLPKDGEERPPFDHTLHFEISDPHATDGGIPRVYDTSTEAGGPDWHLLFKYLLQHCQRVHHYDTVYLLVDTRDLTKVEDVEPTLTHWPAVAAWWSSRLRYLGPGAELVDLVFARAAKSTGLHLVHPTWAGTFVLAAMVFLFPSIHFVLLDSDCVPVALFEIEELWALTTQALTFSRTSEQHGGADGPAHKARKTRQDDEEDNKGQRVILFTEPHADINAGLAIILGSEHDSPLDFAEAAEEAGQLPHASQVEYWDGLAAEMLGKYRATTLAYLRNYNDPIYSTVEEQGKVLQSGLALTPMAWAHTRNTVDWAIAWALIGEWASKELFPPPLHGNWPKHGHDGNLMERRPCLVGWARAAFEQGSLPALGLVETRVLPRDSFFQATHILSDYMRPAVVHGYGGAKVDLPVSLPALAKFGWTTLGASLIGTCSCLPQWCRIDSGDSVRPAPGCDVSFKVAPAPLTLSEEVYLMGLWRHLTPAEAVSQQLTSSTRGEPSTPARCLDRPLTELFVRG